MKKQEEQNIYELADFENHCHLWNIIPGGSGNSIALLREIVDSIQYDNYYSPGNKTPVILITGATGKRFTAQVLANSLLMEDVRICPAEYFENGYYSHQFFSDSYLNTAHIVTNIEELQNRVESTLWRYISNRQCSYYNGVKKAYGNTVYCNGLIVLTAHDKNVVQKTILKAVDFFVELEPLSIDMLKAVVHQRLFFCGVKYDGEEVLHAIVEQGAGQIEFVIPFLKQCIMMMKAELADCLDMEIVEKASRLSSSPVPTPAQN